jgi:hypothetical protein
MIHLFVGILSAVHSVGLGDRPHGSQREHGGGTDRRHVARIPSVDDRQGEHAVGPRRGQRYVVVDPQVAELLEDAGLLQVDERDADLAHPAAGLVVVLAVLAETHRVGVLRGAQVALEGQTRPLVGLLLGVRRFHGLGDWGSVVGQVDGRKMRFLAGRVRRLKKTILNSNHRTTILFC